MLNLDLDISEFEEIADRLDLLVETDVLPIIREAAEFAVNVFDGIARRTYPPPVRVLRQSPHWTPKQTRWWWWVMNMKASGREAELKPEVRFGLIGWKAAYVVVDGVRRLELSGHYRRTGQLVRTLAAETTVLDGGVEIRYGPSVGYAEPVIGAGDDQARYHRGNWVPMQNLVDQHHEAITTIFLDEVMRLANDKLEGKT